MKGLGLVGAVRRLMLDGYSFPRVAGTSAGAIVAAFLAAGVTADEIDRVASALDYSRVPDRAPPGIPLVSEGISLLTKAGAYEGDYVREFVLAELERRGVRTFRDLRRTDRQADRNLEPFQRYRLVVTATDITNGRLLRLPWDYDLLDLDPDEQLVADAVRASISIPLYFEPVELAGVTLVDGGVLSNFPIEIFDRTDGAHPRWPTFGVKVVPDLPGADSQVFPEAALPQLPPVRLLERVVATALVGNDQTYTQRRCVRRRTIEVDTSGVGIVDFDASPDERERLVRAGDEAAARFLATWDWDAYRRDCAGVGES